MSDKDTAPAQGGIGLCGATFLVFLVLKLTGHIDWSWWWVTAPLWLPTVVIIGIVLVVLILIVCGIQVIDRLDKRKDRKREKLRDADYEVK